MSTDKEPQFLKFTDLEARFLRQFRRGHNERYPRLFSSFAKADRETIRKYARRRWLDVSIQRCGFRDVYVTLAGPGESALDEWEQHMRGHMSNEQGAATCP